MLPALFLPTGPIKGEMDTAGVIEDAYARLTDEDDRRLARSDMMKVLTLSGAKLLPGEDDVLDVSIKTKEKGSVVFPLNFTGNLGNGRRRDLVTNKITSTAILGFKASDLNMQVGKGQGPFPGRMSLSSFEKVSGFSYPFEQEFVVMVESGGESIQTPVALVYEINRQYWAATWDDQPRVSYRQFLEGHGEGWEDYDFLKKLQLITDSELIDWYDVLSYHASVKSTKGTYLAQISCDVTFKVPMSVRKQRMEEIAKQYGMLEEDLGDEWPEFDVRDFDPDGIGKLDDGTYNSDGVILEGIKAEVELYRRGEPASKKRALA